MLYFYSIKSEIKRLYNAFALLILICFYFGSIPDKIVHQGVSPRKLCLESTRQLLAYPHITHLIFSPEKGNLLPHTTFRSIPPSFPPTLTHLTLGIHFNQPLKNLPPLHTSLLFLRLHLVLQYIISLQVLPISPLEIISTNKLPVSLLLSPTLHLAIDSIKI
jgi:hypothetical protein